MSAFFRRALAFLVAFGACLVLLGIVAEFAMRVAAQSRITPAGGGSISGANGDPYNVVPNQTQDPRYAFPVAFVDPVTHLYLPTSPSGQAITSTPPLQNGATGNGNGNDMTITGYGTATVSVWCSVSCTGGTTQVNFLTGDGTNAPTAAVAHLRGTNTYASSSVLTGTAVSYWDVRLGSASILRVSISNYSVGTVNATAVALPMVGEPSPITCNAFASDRSSTADVQLVPLTTGQTIRICKYMISGESTTGSDVNLRTDTNANCITAPSNVDVPETVGTSTSGGMIPGFFSPGDVWAGMAATVSQNLCVHRSAAQVSEVRVWYNKF